MTTKTRAKRISEINVRRQNQLTVVLEDIHDPHNAGAMFRTCDAFGIREIHLVFQEEKPWNLSLAGATAQSAQKWLSIHLYPSREACLKRLSSQNFQLITTSLKPAAVEISQLKLNQAEKYALIVGNEHRGVSKYFINHSQYLTKIPMRGMVQSLNVSVATAIYLYQLTQVFK